METANFLDNILVLKDLKTIPDIVHEYTPKDQKSPLIIDNGSFQCRAGFGNKKAPQLIFKNLVGKC
jgi:actin-related protein 5